VPTALSCGVEVRRHPPLIKAFRIVVGGKSWDGADMLSSLVEPLLFPVPNPSYGATGMKGSLVWLPWTPRNVSVPSSCKGLSGALPCIWLPSKESSQVLIYFHANAEDLGMIYGAVKQLQKELKLSILAVEYPGYGLLKDIPPSEERIYHAATVALTYLVDEVGVPCSEVILLGRSLGSASALHLAARYPVAGLVLVNAFSSVRAVAEAKVGKALAWLSFGNVFANDVNICRLACSLLLVHGADDCTVPPEHSKLLHSLAPPDIRKVIIHPEGMNHNSSMFDSPDFLIEPMKKLLRLEQRGRAPKLPAEVFEPKILTRSPSTSKSLSGCAAAHNFCSTNCPALAELEAGCDLAVPTNAAPLGDVQLEDSILSPNSAGECETGFNPGGVASRRRSNPSRRRRRTGGAA